MRILLFGKNGQVARAMQETASAPAEVIALGRQEVDLLQSGASAAAINTYQPDIIVNAAAYTAVDEAETEPEVANKLNATAVAEMADAARQASAHFIHLSTDYVFDGEKSGAYIENDRVNPLSVYGQSKLNGERAALDAYDQSIVLRTSWVFSQFGANFVKTMLRLSIDRDALTIVSDQIGGPTAAHDIARAIFTIADEKTRNATGSGVYHYQGAPPLSWFEFAKEIFDIAGAAIAVSPIPTTDYPTPAIRPLRTVLDCTRIEQDFGITQPDWRKALRETIATLQKRELS